MFYTVDQRGCITRPKLMSRFTKIKNFGASASVLSYAHFQAFKFPDSMEVHFQCTIQICRYHCPDQCADHHHGAANTILHDGPAGHIESHRTIGHNEVASYGYPPPPVPLPIEAYLQVFLFRPIKNFMKVLKFLKIALNFQKQKKCGFEIQHRPCKKKETVIRSQKLYEN